MSLLEQDHQEGAGVRERYEVYKNTTMYENVTRARPPMSQLPIVWPSQARPFQACYESTTSSDCTQWLNLSKLQQRQLLCPSSYGCSGRVGSSGCQWCKISYQRYDQPEWRVASYQRYECKNDLCGYALNQCLDDLCGRWPMWTITYVVYLHVGNIFRSNIYLCFVHLSRNEVIISRASLDGVESERLVGRNRAHSSFVQASALLSVLVRVTG